MTPPTMRCPFCGNSFALTAPPGPDRRVFCPGCRSALPVPARLLAQFTPAPAPAFAAAPAPAPAPAPFRPVPLAPVPPAPPAAPEPWPAVKKPLFGPGLLLAAGLGSLLLLAGSALLAVKVISWKQPPAEPASITQPGPGSPPAAGTGTAGGHAPRPAEPPWLPPDVQRNVNQAIGQGVVWLRKQQNPTGVFGGNPQLGYTALPALTLLECGVPANDPQIQKAAAFVRDKAPKYAAHTETYELSLAVLFLDRLGDPADRPLIRSTALRLVAGQRADGGWTYGCPPLSETEQPKFLDYLAQTRGRPLELLHRQGGTATQPVRVTGTPGGALMRTATPAEAEKLRETLPPRLRTVPAVTVPLEAKPEGKLPSGPSDNSNTQFAVLALWAASRHDLPLERSLSLVARRFRHTQEPQGTWRYKEVGHRTPAMTGVGLLGLAVGHGLKPADPAGKRERDPDVERGLAALAKHIGNPPRRKKAAQRGERNLYFLWTVERVAVLYGLREIEGKDWYRWGTDFLLTAKRPDGSWAVGGYFGSSPVLDTSLALLFLRRANLTADLAGKLEGTILLRSVDR